MCGICGRVLNDPAGRVDAGLLAEMNRRLKHRGPDEAGSYSSAGVGLAASRLSVIDVKGGSQPVSNETGDVVVVYNGEIYNAPELRGELAGKGHSFKSRADTEVLVHLYEEHGEALVDRLRGMFAFALWDGRKKTLLLARDRAGKKPLYYARTEDGLVFASEIKSLLADAGVDTALDGEQLFILLALQYIPSPGTPFKGIRKLPPGCVMSVRQGTEELRRYWRLESRGGPSDYDSAVRKGREVLEEAVRIRLASDVPLGAFLSGGIDSSSIVALMAKNTGNPVKTFCVALDTPGGRADARYARMTAERWGCEHTEVTMSEEEALRELDPVFDALDDPVLDPACLPTYLVSRAAREKVTVALSGEGGDEAFGGYLRYHLARAGSLRAPWLREAAEYLAEKGLARRNAVKAAWRLTEDDPVRRHLYTVTAFTPGEYVRLFKSALEPAERAFRPVFEGRIAGSALSRIAAVDAETWLADGLMQKVDRMSMAVSLEARAPFTDQRLVEFACSLPASFKIRGTLRKRILKDMAADLVPKAVLSRGKVGFEPPWGRWFRGALREKLMDSISDSGLELWRFADRKAVGETAEAHMRKDRDSGLQLFMVYALGEWFRRYGSRS